MDLQYFTIEHAAEKYVTPVGEIRHLIERGDLSACLYAHKRSFLILEKRDKETIGVGMVAYSGLIRPKPVVITDLLHERKIRLDQPVVVLSPKGIYDWKSDHPFDQKSFLASLRLQRWEPTTCREAKQAKYLLAVITPSQNLGMKRLLAQATRKMAEFSPEGKEGADPEAFPTFEYTWDKSAEFHIDDIRIERREIERVVTGQKVTDEKQTAPEVAPEAATVYGRRNGIRDLITVILREDGDLSANAIWKILRTECGRSERVYDIEDILVEVDREKLEWTNTKGFPTPLKRSSFDVAVSRIKKKLASEKTDL